jgi:hypothetical protein
MCFLFQSAALMYYVEISRSPDKDKKLRVRVSTDNKVRTFDIGDTNYEDYMSYREINEGYAELRREAYIKRHKANEDWTETGIFTKGFWSYWLLWNGIDRLPTTLARRITFK